MDKLYNKRLSPAAPFPLGDFWVGSLGIMEIDNKDAKIIEILKHDSRLPIREIAKLTKIRPSTVHQRMQKLIKNRIIEKFTIKPNNKAVGENFIVFMFVKGGPTEFIDPKILGNSHVKEVFGVTGEYDVIMKLKFKGVEEFHDFILGFRKKDIQSTLTMVVTADLKEEI